MNNRQLARKVRRQLSRARRNEEISDSAYAKAYESTFSSAAMSELNSKISTAQLNPWEHRGVLMTSLKGFDFSNIWDWFQENWPEILRMLMLILPLLLDDGDRE